MNKKTILGLLAVLFVLATLSACGGGGGGGAFFLPPAPSSSKATLTLVSAGTGTPMYGVQVTIDLPSGVSAKGQVVTAGTATTVSDPPGVLVSSVTGTDVMALASYVTTTTSAKITINIAKTSGFDVGEFAKVYCDIHSGSPSATSFTLSNFKAVDADGNTIASITPAFTADIQ